jgi:nucleoside phosphorylase
VIGAAQVDAERFINERQLSRVQSTECARFHQRDQPPQVTGAMTHPSGKASSGWWDVTIGIIAALPVEGAAMGALISGLDTVRIEGDPNDYRVGHLDSTDPARPHRVVLTTMPRDNTRSAAAICTDLIRTFTSVRCVVMIGVAGGVPSPERPERHVRLGDVVVALDGIVDYGHIRLVHGNTGLRRSVDGISIELVRASRELQVREYASDEDRWSQWLAPARDRPMAVFARPPASTDRLYVRGEVVEHPPATVSGHRPGWPKIHYGAVGCADVLLRDERRRDELAAEYGIVAVEMEGSGIAAGAVLHGVAWFMVRGVADYCEEIGKNDLWQAYASLTAAGCLRALLGVCRPFPAWRVAPRSRVIALLPDHERDRLFGLLARAPGLDLRELWRTAIGDLTPMPVSVPATIYELFDELAAVNAGADSVPPALALVEGIAGRVDEQLGADLRTWIDQMAVRLQIVDVMQRHRRDSSRGSQGTRGSRPCLIIQIVPDGIDDDQCLISYWIQYRAGPWRPEPGGEPRQTLLSNAEPAVESAVRHAERAWRDSTDPVGVEFLLPTELLHLAVEWWRTELESAAPSPLCLDYPVVVRSLDRMRAEFRHRVWANRWNALWQDPPAHRLYWGRVGEVEPDLTDWNARLREDTAVTSVVLSAPPQHEAGRAELELALRAGVPVILWDRRLPLRDETMAMIKELTRGHPDELPGKVRMLRASAARASTTGQQPHPGRHLALLWDDPHRPIEARRPDR